MYKNSTRNFCPKIPKQLVISSWMPQILIFTQCILPLPYYPRANGAERRSGRKPGARVLIPPGYLHPGTKGKH